MDLDNMLSFSDSDHEDVETLLSKISEAISVTVAPYSKGMGDFCPHPDFRNKAFRHHKAAFWLKSRIAPMSARVVSVRAAWGLVRPHPPHDRPDVPASDHPPPSHPQALVLRFGGQALRCNLQKMSLASASGDRRPSTKSR